MPTAAGPNTLGESNLVFAYDTGDVSNSYKGQPTVNVLPSNAVLLTSYNDHGGTHVTDTGFTLFGNATLRNTSNPAQDWNGVYLTGLSSILTPGVTYTYSFYIYFTSDNTTITYFGYGAPYFTGVKGQWNRVSTTFTATSQDHIYVTLQYSNGQPVSTYYLANLQIEQKSNPTQFVNGTRSATQGLLPVIGNSTIDLTNVSFDSNAQIEFDGTNDFIDTNFPATTLNTPTIEAVVYRSTATGRYESIVQSNLASDDALYVYPDGRLGFWPCSVSSLTVPTGQWSYVAVSYNGTNLTYCVNGVTETITATCTDITDWDFLRIGAHGVSDGERWIGKIAVSKVYDRALTAQEVKQNYQQYKTRFNLS